MLGYTTQSEVFDDGRFRPLTGPVRQRTLRSSIGCRGVGLHTGARIGLVCHPAEPDTGIVFRRTDINGRDAVIPARWDAVGDARMNTCLSDGQGATLNTVEHLMAALAGAGIDNAVIEVGGPEIPVLDGSAAPFLFLIRCAGIAEQPAPRRALRVLRPVVVEDGDKTAALHPAPGFTVHCEIDFPSPVIGRQELCIGIEGFQREVSRARTFGFEQDVAQLRAAGLAKGGSLDNAVVIGLDHRVLNDGGLRYADEFVRHKALDAVGDLYLAGAPIIGHFHGIRSGHALHNRLLRALFADPANWSWTAAQPAEAGFSPLERKVSNG